MVHVGLKKNRIFVILA